MKTKDFFPNFPLISFFLPFFQERLPPGRRHRGLPRRGPLLGRRPPGGRRLHRQPEGARGPARAGPDLHGAQGSVSASRAGKQEK